MIEFEIPITTISESNRRGHWRKHAGRHKSQREAARLFANPRCLGMKDAAFMWRVTLVRLSPRLLDDDNLRGALKHVRDGIADAIGIDDRKGEWRYRQTKRKQPGVMVHIEPATPACPDCHGTGTAKDKFGQWTPCMCGAWKAGAT